MNLQTLVNSLLSDTLQVSLPLYKPELALCATIVLLLLVRVFRGGELIPSVLIALVGSGVALWLALPAGGVASWSQTAPQEIFTGMLVVDSLTHAMRVFLLVFAVLFVVLAWLTGIADREDGQDFYALALGATLGMCIMSSANHLLTVFLGVEMASVPSYVLAGIVKGRRRSSEAALKYAVYGAGAAGVMLYGISLLAGILGTAHIPTMARELVELNLPEMLLSGEQSRLVVMVLALGGLMLGVGLAFKLSAVPFHFWCPDVFEGASAEVDAFLSVASKAAALALLVRVALGLSQYQERTTDALAQENRPAIVAAVAMAETPARTVQNTEDADGIIRPADESPLAPVRRYLVILIAIVAVVTCTFGNLAAYGQTNIKRMFAYSTIAHAGFMMMAVAAAVALLGQGAKPQEALSALMLYVFFYLFMNLGAFAVVAFLRNSMQSEEIADYAGLIRSCPLVTVVMTAILVSLIGLPPLAGFWPKLDVLMALYTAGGPLMMFVLVVAALNTAISLVYYVRVAKVMCIYDEPDTRGPVSIGFLSGAYVLAVGLPVIVFGLLPNVFKEWANAAVSQILG